MTRILLVVLICAAALVVHPPLRAWVKPYGESVARPAYRQYARWRIQEITRLLEHQVESNRPLPGRSTFTAFLERGLGSERAARDPWGTPYFLKAEPFSIRVGSAGPDRKVGTDDDLLGRQIGTGRIRLQDH